MRRSRIKALVWILRTSPRSPEVLVLERPAQRGGGFHPVTGKVEAGEAPEEAAAREAFEETGLRGELIDLRFRHEFEHPRRGRFVECGFLLVVSSGSRERLSQEHVSAAWLSPQEAMERLGWEAHKAALALALEAFAKAQGTGTGGAGCG